jgi:hypothetical protein
MSFVYFLFARKTSSRTLLLETLVYFAVYFLFLLLFWLYYLLLRITLASLRDPHSRGGQFFVPV